MDYNLLTLAELQKLAKEENIKRVTGIKKQDLIAVLEETLKKKEAAQEKETPAAKPATRTRTKAVKAGEEEKPVKAPAKTRVSKKAAEPEKPAEAPVSAPAEPAGTVPVRTYESQAVRREVVSPAQTGVRREPGAPVRRPMSATRPMQPGEQRPAPVSRPMQPGRPAGPMQQSARPAAAPGQQPVRPAAAPAQQPVRPAPAPAQQPVRPATGEAQSERPAVQDRFQVQIPEGASPAETLAAYIAQNYSLVGTPQDSGETKEGILEVMPEGFAFVRCDNFLPGPGDVYVSPAQVKRFGLKTGDYIVGNTKVKMPNEKFSALYYINTVNKLPLSEVVKRKKFEDLTPIFPNQRFHLETPGCGPAMRMVDLLSPIGKGQRGMIVSQPKAGKTTLLKQIAKALIRNHPSIHLIILLIDERPEEVTDMKESINGENVEVIYSTFDEQPENHKRVSEMVIERARRLVEQKQDVVILLDSITRLARAYNLTITASGRTLSGGLDPAALYMPKRFFGAARCMREGGSLTVLATALVETGSRMDDVVFEEFKGTGNMELVLDRNLSERRVFPAIDLPKSGTRREDLLLTATELEASNIIRRAFNSSKTEEVVERIINLFTHTRNNAEFVEMVKKTRIVP